MWLFRKSFDLSRAQPRLVGAEDLSVVARLLSEGTRRYHSLSGGDLAALLAAGRGAVLDAAGELYGVAVASWPADAGCWIRAVALAEGVDLRSALILLMRTLHTTLADHGTRMIFYGGDEAADGWLLPALLELGYDPDTEVVVYEKQRLDIPDHGHPAVLVRPAVPADLGAVLALDRACFEPQWTKDDTVLGPSIEQGPYFVVAELAGQTVGYAYATAHFGGRLVHLVRIAVDPAYRGARIGVRLLAEVVGYARQQQASTITLNTQAYNIHAQRLYRWFGFAATGERQPILRRRLQP